MESENIETINNGTNRCQMRREHNEDVLSDEYFYEHLHL